MKTELLLALRPGSGGNTALERLQGAIESAWPYACGLPPLIPILRLESMPVYHSLLQAKGLPWPLMEIQTSVLEGRDPAGNLVLPIQPGPWDEYRTGISKIMGMNPPTDDCEWLPCGPWLLIAMGPGGAKSQDLPVFETPNLLFHAPLLVVIKIQVTCATTFFNLNWGILAEHRVAKAR